MRGVVFACCACAVAASVAGDFDQRSGAFLASLSRSDGASAPSGDATGEYARQTQSPMVWLNLRKSDLDAELVRRSAQRKTYASQMRSGDFDA